MVAGRKLEAADCLTRSKLVEQSVAGCIAREKLEADDCLTRSKLGSDGTISGWLHSQGIQSTEGNGLLKHIHTFHRSATDQKQQHELSIIT